MIGNSLSNISKYDLLDNPLLFVKLLISEITKELFVSSTQVDIYAQTEKINPTNISSLRNSMKCIVN